MGKALVLCGGLGTRLGELTRDRPKVLLPLAGAPLLAYTLSHLARHAFRDVAINLHHRGATIREAIGDGSRYGVRVHYVDEDELLGTAGSVRNLASYFADAEDALVVYGDLLFDEDLTSMLAFHRDRAADATLLLHKRARSNSAVLLAPDGRIRRFLERPDRAEREAARTPWVNSGVQFLARRFIERIRPGADVDLPRDVYRRLAPSARLYGFPCTGYRCAIDSPARYRQAERALGAGRVRIVIGSPPIRAR